MPNEQISTGRVSFSIFGATAKCGLQLWQLGLCILVGLALNGTFAFANTNDYAITTWRMKDGLPLDTVRSLLQTRDHYLWIATPNGLARFDGTRFVVFEAANTKNLPNNLVTAMHEDDQGNLWLGLETGELVRYRHGQFFVLPKIKGWPAASVACFVSGAQGQFFALSQWGAILEITNSSPGFLLRSGAPNRVQDLIKDLDGKVWVKQADGFSLLSNGKIIPASDVPPAVNPPSIAFTARDGGIWILDKSRLRRWRNGGWVEDRGASPPLLSEVPIAVETTTGRIMAGSFRQGLYLSETNGTIAQLSIGQGLQSDWINCVLEDHEGGMWVGTSGGGLSRIRPAVFSSLLVGGEIPPCALLSVARGTNDDLWFGSEGEGVLHFEAGKWSDLSEDNGLTHPIVRSVLCDRHGTVFAGTWGGGLFQLKSNHFVRAEGWTRTLDDVMCLYQDRQGNLFAGTRVGLLQLRSNVWDFVKHHDQSLSGDIRSIAVDGQGALWVGTAGAGLWCLQGDDLKRYGPADGVRSDNIWAILPDRYDANTVWVGTQGDGLLRIRNGKVSSFTTDQGLPANTICNLVEDNDQRLWLATYEGIVQVTKDDLNTCADGSTETVRSRVFDVSDGLISRDFSAGKQPTACRTTDGKMWFATSKGVAVLPPDLADTRPRALPPPVNIELVLANDVEVAGPDAAANVQLGPGLQRLEIQYGAVSFTSPGQVHFRYRLRGLEDSWVNAETRRIVHYSHLPPGDFIFEVKASNSDGEWSTAPTVFEFSVRSFWWQRRPVQFAGLTAGVLAAISTTYLLTRARQRRKLAALHQQNALERERIRIANDIHDDLGANLTRISMLSDMVSAEVKLASGTASMVGEIAGCARSSVSALDEIVWAVNPRHDTMDGLLDYVSNYCHAFLEDTGVLLQLTLPPPQPTIAINSELRYGVLMIIKETLNNSVKHAGPCTLHLTIKAENHQLEVLISDTGRGFQVSDRSTGTRSGLTSMTERATALGGTLEIQSQPGAGTRVLFRVPLWKNSTHHDE